jgi:hypothetical protein
VFSCIRTTLNAVEDTLHDIIITTKLSQFNYLFGLSGARSQNLTVMLTTTTLVAPFGFVVWTISSLSGLPFSLYTFPFPGLARYSHFTGFTEFDRFY